MPRYFFVAGESSGDAHGAALIAALRARAPEVVCEGLGGPRMAAAGMALRHDLASEAIMGFTEVVKHLPAIRRLFHETVAHLRATRPDALVLVDYPGFNIRLARAAHALGIRVVYYIGPQVWAWKKGRIRTLAECVDKMLVIFPFEEAIYKNAGMDCVYVGHPLIERVAAFRPGRVFEGAPVIGILPGSRAQEIARLLGPMLETARVLRETYPGAVFATPCVDRARADQIRALAGGFPLEIVPGGMYDVLHAARGVLVASGTATLEGALFHTPMALMYRVSPLTYALARALVDIEYIGIVNILAGRGVAPEFIQEKIVPTEIAATMRVLLEDTPERAAMLEAFCAIEAQLGGEGASDRAAKEILM
mgnify:CR=1 FL=1